MNARVRLKARGVVSFLPVKLPEEPNELQMWRNLVGHWDDLSREIKKELNRGELTKDDLPLEGQEAAAQITEAQWEKIRLSEAERGKRKALELAQRLRVFASEIRSGKHKAKLSEIALREHSAAKMQLVQRWLKRNEPDPETQALAWAALWGNTTSAAQLHAFVAIIRLGMEKSYPEMEAWVVRRAATSEAALSELDSRSKEEAKLNGGGGTEFRAMWIVNYVSKSTV